MGKPFFNILIRSWNAFEYFDRCIDSVYSQIYKNYKILFIDDASEYTREQKNIIKRKLKRHVVVFNNTRKFSVFNGYFMLHEFAKNKESVCMTLDGDDWLFSKNALSYIAKFYEKKEILFTYGSCLFWDGKRYLKSHPLYSSYTNTHYPKVAIKKRLFRREYFRVSHPMTFKTSLFKQIKESDFKEEAGTWLKYELDLATYLPMLEMANGKFKFIKRSLSVYNISSPNLNIKINPYPFAREELIIRKKNVYEPLV